MGNPSTHEITQLLVAWNHGDQAALEALSSLINQELHRLAKRYMADERSNHLLQPTALVNEAWLRLIDWRNVEWESRTHFLGLAAQIMRHILVEFARTKTEDGQIDNPMMKEIEGARCSSVRLLSFPPRAQRSPPKRTSLRPKARSRIGE